MKNPQTASLAFSPPDSIIFECDDAAPAVLLQWSTVGEDRGAIEMNAEVTASLAEAFVTAAWAGRTHGVVTRGFGGGRRGGTRAGGIWAVRIAIELERSADTLSALDVIRAAVRQILAPTTTISDAGAATRYSTAADYYPTPKGPRS